MEQVIKLLEKELQRDKSLKGVFEERRKEQEGHANPNYPIIIETYEKRIAEFEKAIQILKAQ